MVSVANTGTMCASVVSTYTFLVSVRNIGIPISIVISVTNVSIPVSFVVPVTDVRITHVTLISVRNVLVTISVMIPVAKIRITRLMLIIGSCVAVIIWGITVSAITTSIRIPVSRVP